MAKRIYNKVQEEYLLAKAQLELLEEEENKLEQKFIIEKGIVNADGSIPVATYAIDDDETADKAIDDFGKLVVDCGLWAKILKARETLKAAESNLVEYGLSIAPKKEREILEKAARTNYTVRRKIIDLVIKLDARTVTV